MAAPATDQRKALPRCAAALLLAAFAGEGAAAAASSFAIEATSDARRRGLSWSDGKPALEASARLPVGGLHLGADVLTTRGAARHGGADAAARLSGWWVERIGVAELSGGVNYHLFAGASAADFGSDFVELGAGGAVSLGPARVDFTILYAPPQASLGGSLLYLSADASAGIPGTPFTIEAGVGRSSGQTDDAAVALRLRPQRRYVDARLGVTMVSGPLRLGARLTTTGISADAPHAGTRLAISAAFDF